MREDEMSNNTKELKIASLERLGILKKKKIKKEIKSPKKGFTIPSGAIHYIEKEEREKCVGV